MQVTEETPAGLMLERRPWLPGGAQIVCILVLLALAMRLCSESAWLTLGLGLAAVLLAVCFVILGRASGARVIKRRSQTGQSEQTLALDDITGSKVESSRSTLADTNGSRTTSITRRPVLTTCAVPVPLTHVFSSGTGAKHSAAVINHWLCDAAG